MKTIRTDLQKSCEILVDKGANIRPIVFATFFFMGCINDHAPEKFLMGQAEEISRNVSERTKEIRAKIKMLSSSFSFNGAANFDRCEYSPNKN